MTNLALNDTADQIDLSNGVLANIRSELTKTLDGPWPSKYIVIDGLALGSVISFVGTDTTSDLYIYRLAFLRAKMAERLNMYFGHTKSGLSFVVFYQETTSGFVLLASVLDEPFPHHAPLEIFEAVRKVAKHHDVDEPFEVSLAQIRDLPHTLSYDATKILWDNFKDRINRLLEAVRIYCDWTSSKDVVTYTFTRR